MKKFSEADAPQVVAIKLKGNKEKHYWRALKVFAKYFDTKATLVSVQAVVEFWGYELVVVDGYYCAVALESRMDDLLATDPELWVHALELSVDREVVEVIS